VRLRQLLAELGDRVTLRWRAFPLRPVPDTSVTFKGTYREAAWQRCNALAADTGVTFRMWERSDFPTWSMPALEAAKCVALQGEELFDALHLRLYRAFFEEGVNIGLSDEVAGVVRALPGLDVSRFLHDYESGKGREHGVRAIPTVVLPTGQRIVGAVSLAEYRRALAA
jgi:predicted DsbA family dithiol-disulfide isomerase